MNNEFCKREITELKEPLRFVYEFRWINRCAVYSNELRNVIRDILLSGMVIMHADVRYNDFKQLNKLMYMNAFISPSAISVSIKIYQCILPVGKSNVLQLKCMEYSDFLREN